jgi:hypothetical protein
MRLAAALLITAASGPTFTSSWMSPDAAGVSFAGRKVAAVVMSADQDLRISAEEQLARELTARNIQGVAAYRIIPREETFSAERARPWIERAAVEGVVVLRPVSVETERTYSPAVWTQNYYTTLWGYYGYGWSGFYDPGGVREDSVLVVESLIYDVPRDQLLWAGVSTTTNPKEAQKFVAELAAATVEEMKKRLGGKR